MKSDPNAIGYVSLDFTKGVHTIPYQGVPCTLRNAKSGQYGGVRNFCMVTRGAAKGAAEVVLNFVRCSKAARRSSPATGSRSARWRPGRARLLDATSAPSALLGALACLVLLLIAGMVVFVFAKAWPSFAHNGLAWFGAGGDVDQQLEDIFNSPADPRTTSTRSAPGRCCAGRS